MTYDSGLLAAFREKAQAQELDYLIIGGYAASFWGTPRFTADVDYVIERKSLEKAKIVASELGYELEFLHPEESFAHFKSREKGNFRIDFMLVDPNTWNTLKQDSLLADFGDDEPHPIVSPLHLIAMKLHSAKQVDRSDFFKDLNDIVEIMLAQDISYGKLEDSGILDTHGTQKTISLLKQILQSKGHETSKE